MAQARVGFGRMGCPRAAKGGSLWDRLLDQPTEADRVDGEYETTEPP